MSKYRITSTEPLKRLRLVEPWLRTTVADASQHFLGGAALRHFWRGGLERPLRSLRIKTITDSAVELMEQSFHICCKIYLDH